MTSYPELRRLVNELEAGQPPAALDLSAARGQFRARLLRPIRTERAQSRRRSLLLLVRAYRSLARAQRARAAVGWPNWGLPL